jgi:hypothetical protein
MRNMILTAFIGVLNCVVSTLAGQSALAEQLVCIGVNGR